MADFVFVVEIKDNFPYTFPTDSYPTFNFPDIRMGRIYAAIYDCYLYTIASVVSVHRNGQLDIVRVTGGGRWTALTKP